MPSPGLSTTFILGEIIFIETVFIIAVSVYLVLKLKKKSVKLKNLFESFLDDEENRLSRLSLTFKKPEFIDDKKYNEILKNIINEENLLYKYLINAFYHNDIKLLDTFSTEIQKITKPCAELLLGNKTPETNEINNDPIINDDDNINELLSDDEEINVEVEHDPEFDLSKPTETVTETPTEELIERSIENDEIAEIPSDLVNNTPSKSENERKNEGESEKTLRNISESDEQDSTSSENKPEK